MKPIIISPSGNLYGSEQVLIDYLQNTSLPFILYIKSGGKFAKFLDQFNINFIPFNKLSLLYWKVALQLLKGTSKSVYINEGGHIRYALLLSKIFPNVKIIVHIRIIEDTDSSRLPKILPGNVTIISISKFIQSRISLKSILLYDLYNFSSKNITIRSTSNTLNVAIIGRISITKGVKDLYKIALAIGKMPVKFHLYGLPSNEIIDTSLFNNLKSLPNINIKGFLTDKSLIYDNDVVLHLAKEEPLGRIFLEAIDYGIPFIGINSGGIGEIAALLNLQSFVIESNEELVSNAISKILKVGEQKEAYWQKTLFAKERAKQIFSVENYVNTLDKLLRN